MLRTATATAIALIIAGSASAEGLSYGRLSFDYRSFSNEFFDDRTQFVQGYVEYQTGQFLLSAEFENFNANPEFGDSTTASFFALSGGYFITPEALVGGVLTGLSRDSGDISGYEGYAQYQADQFGVGVNVRKFDADADNVSTTLFGEYYVIPAVSLTATASGDSEFDGNGYRFAANYADGPTQARAYYVGHTEDDVNLFGVRGSYDVTPDIRATGAYSTFVGNDADLSFFSIGGGYRITDGLWAEADYGQFSEDASGGDEIKRISLALTYEIGDRIRIDQRFYQDLVDDNSAGLRF